MGVVGVSSADIVILDYGSGNLRSAQRAIEHVGAQVEVTADPDRVLSADGLVVPGVGAFAACMAGLNSVNGPSLIDKRLAGARPVLGICVGMQVLFDLGVEHGIETPGCGQWPGVVDELTAPVLPHMGWDTVEPPSDTRLFAGIENQRFYFVHSFAARNWDMDTSSAIEAPAVTWAHYGERFVAAVENGPLSATQFHPEKSSDAGLALLQNWVSSLA